MSGPLGNVLLMVAEMIEAGGPGSGPQGGSGSAGLAGGKSHSVKLPPNPKKMNISHAAQALDQMGMKLGTGKTSLIGGKFVVSYTVTRPDGSSELMSVDNLKALVYSGAAK